MIEMFAPLKADARAVAGQLLEFLLREGLQNIDQGKELRRRSLSCHVMHIAVSIPYESNSGVSVIEGESGRTDESLHRFFAFSLRTRSSVVPPKIASLWRSLCGTRPRRDAHSSMTGERNCLVCPFCDVGSSDGTAGSG